MMRRLHLRRNLCLVGVAWSAVFQAAYAEKAHSKAEELLTESPATESARTKIPALSDVEHPPTSVSEWLSQSPDADRQSLVRITDVQLNSTETGLEIVLVTSEGPLPPVSTSVVGNALIADIPNVVLALPDTDEFQAANPTDDIALVSVTNLPDDQIRVAITGLSGVPAVDIRTGETELVFNVTAPEIATDSVETAITENDGLRVVVTAERTPEVVQDVPISLTVLTEQEIEDADITSLEEIAGNTPNFSAFSATNSRSFTFYSIRGLSNSNFGSRDPVAFYVDDVPYDYGSFIDLDLPDIQQVEILRGPQNTLYGRSSQAGVVNIITRKPTNELAFNSAISYGNFDTLDLRAGVSGPIIEDELFYRLSGSYESRDGFYDNRFLDGEVDEKSGWTGRAQLLWTPAEAWEISFNAAVEDYQDGAYPLVDLEDDDPFEIEQDFNGFSDLSTNSQNLRVVYRQPNFRVTSITTRRFSEQTAEGEIDLSVADVLRSDSTFDSTVWTQEFRLQSPEDAEQFQWIVGGYFESREFNNNRPYRKLSR